MNMLSRREAAGTPACYGPYAKEAPVLMAAGAGLPPAPVRFGHRVLRSSDVMAMLCHVADGVKCRCLKPAPVLSRWP